MRFPKSDHYSLYSTFTLTLTNKQLQNNRIQHLRGDLKQVIKIEIALRDMGRDISSEM